MDLSYTDALGALGGERVVVLGPVPCHTCGAWVEWAGVDWLALGTDERHQCAPYLEDRREHVAYLEEFDSRLPEPYLMAHRMPANPPLPRWVHTLGTVIATVALVLAWLVVLNLVLPAGRKG